MKETAGTLLYRKNDNQIEVLLIHPSGSYNKNSPWGIPKGMPDPGEELEVAGRRETLEEAGVQAEKLEYIGFIDYTKTKKRVHCWMGLAPENCQPRCASWEVDRAEFVSLKEAEKIIHPDQTPFIDRLKTNLLDMGIL